MGLSRHERTSAFPRTVLRLAEVDLADAPIVGRKAGVLGHLLRAGFPVPVGVVLTAGGPELTEEDVQRLLHAVAELGDRPVAVRSSGADEDRSDRSGAGRYETVLGVRGETRIVAAVRRCLASALADRRPREMAVLVQPLIDPDVAGVAFTANPVTGARDEMIVNAVPGLADRFVAGEMSPAEWIVRGGTVNQVAGPAVIDRDQVRAVAGLARRVADDFGQPHDIEWAIRDNQVWLLQARPITTLPPPPVEPVPVPVDPPAGFWLRDDGHLPHPRSPVLRSVHRFNDAMWRMSEAFGFLVSVEARDIGGWTYAGPVPTGGIPGITPPPTWLMRILINVVPELRRRVRTCVEAARSGLAGQYVERWYEEWRPALSARVAALRDEDPAELPDGVLERHLSAACKLLDDGTHLHFLLFGAYSLEVGELALTARELLGWSDQQTLHLLAGASARSTEPGRGLAELARMASHRPLVRSWIEEPRDPEAVDQLTEIDPEFARAFDEYLRTYGHRALLYDVSDPALIEKPGQVLALLRNHLALGDESEPNLELARQRTTATEAAITAFRDRPEDLVRFEEVLARAQRAYPVREDNEFFAISAPLALLRRAVLEAGRRLTERGLLDSPPDVFFLEYDELTAALKAGEDVHAQARRRKGERAWIELHPGPPSYGIDLGEPPWLRLFPVEVRRAMQAFGWTVDQVLGRRRCDPAGGPGGTIAGVAASPGRYRGPVRLIISEREFARLRPGDVLVCPMASSVWSIVFPTIGALVTDSGGTLSHPAIIAREHAVPAVVATGDATRRLHDGQVVLVDGSRGIVETAT